MDYGLIPVDMPHHGTVSRIRIPEFQSGLSTGLFLEVRKKETCGQSRNGIPGSSDPGILLSTRAPQRRLATLAAKAG